MICDDCRSCWFLQKFNCTYPAVEDNLACHHCFYMGHRRARPVDGKCPSWAPKGDKRLNKLRLTDPFERGKKKSAGEKTAEE